MCAIINIVLVLLTCAVLGTLQLETLKYSVDRTATDLESMRAQCSVLSRQTRDQTERLSMYQSQRRALQEEIRKKTKGLLSAEEKAQEMDELLNIEETNVKRIEKELEKTREKQVHSYTCTGKLH